MAEKMVDVIVVKPKSAVKRSVIGKDGQPVSSVYVTGDQFEVPESEVAAGRLGSQETIITVDEYERRQAAEVAEKQAAVDKLRAEIQRSAPKPRQQAPVPEVKKDVPAKK